MRVPVILSRRSAAKDPYRTWATDPSLRYAAPRLRQLRMTGGMLTPATGHRQPATHYAFTY
jgi:hypothetical protein